MIDAVIVGSGISGCCLAWKFLIEGKSIVMISDSNRASSAVAAGVYNPTVLKRFSPVWKGAEQLDVAIPFYEKIENILNVDLLHATTILRRLHDENEAKTWERKSYREDLARFMDSDIIQESFNGIDAPNGFGKVNETGWVDTQLFMRSTISYLESRNQFIHETFDYNQLKHSTSEVAYKHLVADCIIFAEGYSMLKNPYFNNLPLQGNKGEVLTIRVPGLKLNYIIKSSVFLMPYREDLFWVGATYNRDDKSYDVTKEGLEFLTSRLEQFLKLPYEIVEHKTGIRPTTVDRRPFLGSHRENNRLKIFNGMGSRAVLVAPWVVEQLYHGIYNNEAIPMEMDIKRFDQ